MSEGHLSDLEGGFPLGGWPEGSEIRAHLYIHHSPNTLSYLLNFIFEGRYECYTICIIISLQQYLFLYKERQAGLSLGRYMAAMSRSAWGEVWAVLVSRGRKKVERDHWLNKRTGQTLFEKWCGPSSYLSKQIDWSFHSTISQLTLPWS